MESDKGTKRKAFLNASESVNSQNPIYSNDGVMETQTKMLDTKEGPTNMLFEDTQPLRLKSANPEVNVNLLDAKNSKVPRLDPSTKKHRLKTIRVDSEDKSNISKSKILKRINQHPSDDDFDFSSQHEEEDQREVKSTKDQQSEKRKQAEREKKAKEAKEDRKAQILAEIMKYEKIDENAVKMKKAKRPFYAIDPLSNFHLFHCLSVLVSIFLMVIWIAFESSYYDNFTVIIHFVYVLNMADLVLTGLTGVLNKENQVDYNLLLIWRNYIGTYLLVDVF